MMEPSNLDHHHQEELHGLMSSSLPSPSFHLLGGHHDWNHNLILNDGVFIPGSRDFRPSNETPHIVQDLGFHWIGNTEGHMNHSATQATLERIEENYNLSSTSFIKDEQQGMHDDRSPLLGAPIFAGAAAECGRGNYGMVLPTAHVSSADRPPLPSSYQISLGMDLQALDLLASARFGRSFCEPSIDYSMALLRDDTTPFGLISHLQEQAQGPSINGHLKMSPLISGVTESKRGNSGFDHKASAKKPRLIETRSSFSPFKVRKEKLGDRIAALQQLVAPFGKTDTASVLMEAIGYIKFLQGQVETLSVPYMRSSNNIKLRTTQGASSEDTDEPKRDLRSRGLCLVPLSYTSYVSIENGGVWSPPNYRGSN